MINIVIADHEPIFRTGAARVLAVEDDLRIVGQPQSTIQLLKAIERLSAHVLLVSNQFLPAVLEQQGQREKQNPAIVVLADNEDTAASFVAMGAQGIVYRSIEPSTLVQAIRRVAAGEMFIHSPNSEIKEIHDDLVGTHVVDRLSVFELRVIGMMLQSYRNREIANHLNMDEQVVKTAIRSIFDSTGVSDRLELVLFVSHHRMLVHAIQEVQIHTSQPHCRSNLPVQRRSNDHDPTRPFTRVIRHDNGKATHLI